MEKIEKLNFLRTENKMDKILAKVKAKLENKACEYDVSYSKWPEWEFYNTNAQKMRNIIRKIERHEYKDLESFYRDTTYCDDAQEFMVLELLKMFETLDTIGIFDALTHRRKRRRTTILI